jgi:3-phosphoshikimate 1-carboxyvinyltransferase
MRFTEGDWSNAAFWLTAGAIKGSVGCQGLDMESAQGDREIVSILEKFGAETKMILNQITATNKEMKGIHIDAAQIPDLVPVLCVAAAAAEGETLIYNAGRLRMKESDRLAVMAECLQKIGVKVEEREDGLLITGGCNPPEGEIVVDSHNDHRIVMAMAIAAVSLGVDVTIEHAEAVNKSYPSFFIELKKLGGVVDGI